MPHKSRGFLRVGDSIVDFQPLEGCRLRRIEPEFLDLFAEELALFRVIIETACLDLFGPTFDFLRRFLFAALIEPLDYFLVARALLDLRFEIVAFHAFETKEHVIQRTIEVIFPDIARHESAAFVDRASKNRVAADPNARTARRFPR